jgi:putative heme transporter
MAIVIASDNALSELPVPAVDPRALARRIALPALLGAAAGAAVLLGPGHVHAFVEGLRRGLDLSPSWAALGAVFEFASLAGYVALLSLVAGRATARVGARESAQITLAGAAATRLIPTAGVGGLGLTLWALRRAGLRAPTAARTLLSFLVLLYSVFLASIVVSGSILTLGLVGGRGPAELSATAAGAATIAIGLCLVAAVRAGREREVVEVGGRKTRARRLRAGTQLMGEAVREACRLLRSRDPRLAGAVAYWTFDLAVLWAMLRAFGSPSALPIVALAYFVGQLANTLPVPGSVSGGMAGVLIMFGVPAELAIPSVLAYRAVSVWLPAPVAIAAVPGLRRTVASWGRQDGAPATVPLDVRAASIA